jgi:hypothetical protein
VTLAPNVAREFTTPNCPRSLTAGGPTVKSRLLPDGR